MPRGRITSEARWLKTFKLITALHSRSLKSGENKRFTNGLITRTYQCCYVTTGKEQGEAPRSKRGGKASGF